MSLGNFHFGTYKEVQISVTVPKNLYEVLPLNTNNRSLILTAIKLIEANGCRFTTEVNGKIILDLIIPSNEVSRVIKFNPPLKILHKYSVISRIEDVVGSEHDVSVVYCFFEVKPFMSPDDVEVPVETEIDMTEIRQKLSNIEELLKRILDFEPPCGDECMVKYLWDKGRKFEFIQLCWHCPKRKLHL